ncbi:MAG: histidine--tRNA ligase [Phycisphaerales bacterium]|nr:MAG: histidine--tRNA ligase [Phycisphaerales bacterium]
MSFQAPRGMRDFYPEDMAFRTRLFDVWTATARAHGFAQYDAPIVEHLDLLTRKAGEEIIEQIYAFQDKSGRKLALRPEVTPSLVRLVAARRSRIVMPAKWFTIAQCFRYERMSKGRKREHFQWNLDIIGSDSIIADLEVLATAADALRTLGLTPQDANIHVGNRNLVGEMLHAIGVPDQQQLDVLMVLDKRGKVSDEVLVEMLTEAGVAAHVSPQIMKIFDVRDLEDAAALVPADSPAIRELRTLFDLADRAGVGPFLRFDIAVVRGLAYYTGIVFEAFDTRRRFRAILGGGRYDRLFESLGEPPLPAVGFGFGDVVIKEVLDKTGVDQSPGKDVDVCVGVFDHAHWPEALAVAGALRADGLHVDLALGAVGPNKLFKYADRRNASRVVFVAPEELKSDCVVLRDMTTGSQAAVPIPDITAAIRKQPPD